MRAEPSLLELCRVQPKLFKFYCIIPIVLQKISLSMKNDENLDANTLNFAMNNAGKILEI